jgi:hypothetical protein
MRRSLSDGESEKLVSEVESLRALNPEELNRRWQILFGSDRPKRLCGSLLVQALAYSL